MVPSCCDEPAFPEINWTISRRVFVDPRGDTGHLPLAIRLRDDARRDGHRSNRARTRNSGRRCHRHRAIDTTKHSEMEYSVLIRAKDAASTLPAVLRSVRCQTKPPRRVVVVDNGSTDGTREVLSPEVLLIDYVGEAFNYAAAINQGIAFIESEYVLVLSSHTVIGNPRALEFAVEVLENNADAAAVYFSDEAADQLTVEWITSANFDGFNGLWNTSALVRMRLLRARPFRPEVFSAEDQEWAKVGPRGTGPEDRQNPRRRNAEPQPAQGRSSQAAQRVGSGRDVHKAGPAGVALHLPLTTASLHALGLAAGAPASVQRQVCRDRRGTSEQGPAPRSARTIREG